MTNISKETFEPMSHLPSTDEPRPMSHNAKLANLILWAEENKIDLADFASISKGWKGSLTMTYWHQAESSFKNREHGEILWQHRHNQQMKLKKLFGPMEIAGSGEWKYFTGQIELSAFGQPFVVTLRYEGALVCEPIYETTETGEEIWEPEHVETIKHERKRKVKDYICKPKL